MENKQTPITDTEVTFTLNASEIFQLNLCVANRIGFCQQRWSTCLDDKEQIAMEQQIAYLSNLSSKLQKVLSEIKK